jgi:hypothetical protein
MRRTIAALALGALLAVPAGAFAQGGATPSHSTVRREGFIWGFSFGSGFSSTFRPAFSIHLGGMARPDLAVILEAYGVEKPGNDETHTLLAAGAQFWPADHLWVKGAIGYGSTASDDFDAERTVDKIGGMGGVGYEVVRTGRFTLDLQVRGLVTSGEGGGSASFNIGFNWY